MVLLTQNDEPQPKTTVVTVETNEQALQLIMTE